MAISPSGEQFELNLGRQEAVVVEVGGGIRGYHNGDREVLQSYPLDAIADGAHGAPLIPWPNRLADGRYSFDGNDYQAPLTEPEKQNAIHGFLRWRSWHGHRHSAEHVTMSTTLHPMPWYPFTLAVKIEYLLQESGLSVTTKASNLGAAALPYGAGAHPYLSPGEGKIDHCVLRFEAETRIDTDKERQLPTGRVKVAGTPFDFREGRRLGDFAMDFAFTDLARDDDGRAWAHLTGSDDHTASIWLDDSYPLLELYTADTLSPGRKRTGLGCEPMTCPPNAFASGIDVIRIEPGESVTSSWGARLD